jgi:hypothetical protein
MIPFEDGTIAGRSTDGACVFLDGRSTLCSIHRDGGAQALPVTCRMFPRVVLHDARGTFISLSHFCPTAASLLFAPTGGVEIVEAPAALADVGDLDGLDACHVWPPLLRPGVLMDLDSYAAWEASALRTLTRGGGPPRDALAALEDATSRVTSWTPGSGELRDAVRAAFDALGPGAPADPGGDRAAVKRWLAARLFGAWIAYQGDGLAATTAYLRSCLETFEREIDVDGSALEAIRRSDLRILHGPGQ